VDEAEAERCPQEESLRTVLINLGIPESELQGDLHDFPGVDWGGSLGSATKIIEKRPKIFWDKQVVTKSIGKVVKFPGRPRLLKKTVVIESGLN